MIDLKEHIRQFVNKETPARTFRRTAGAPLVTVTLPTQLGGSAATAPADGGEKPLVEAPPQTAVPAEVVPAAEPEAATIEAAPAEAAPTPEQSLPPANLTPEAIIAIAAEVTGVKVADIKGPGRKREYSRPRHMAACFTYRVLEEYKRGKYSLNAIGRHFGNRHHTTILHAMSSTDHMLWSKDWEVRDWLVELSNRCGIETPQWVTSPTPTVAP